MTFIIKQESVYDQLKRFSEHDTLAIKVNGLNIFPALDASENGKNVKIVISFKKRIFYVTSKKGESIGFPSYRFEGDHFLSFQKKDRKKSSNDQIKFDVFFSKNGTMLKLIGSLEINIEDTIKTRKFCKWHLITLNNKETGSIFLTILPQINKISFKHFSKHKDLIDKIEKMHKRNSKSLRKKSKKYKSEELMSKFTYYFIIKKRSDNEEIVFDEMNELLELLRQRDMRIIFCMLVEIALLQKESELIDNTFYIIIRDVFKHILRMSKSQNDFLCCKVIADITQTMYSFNECIYNSLKPSLVYKSIDYYKTVFAAVYSRELGDPEEEKSFSKIILTKYISRKSINSSSFLKNITQSSSSKTKLIEIITNLASTMYLNGLGEKTIVNYISQMISPLLLSFELKNQIDEILQKIIDNINTCKKIFSNSYQQRFKSNDDTDLSSNWKCNISPYLNFYTNSAKHKIKIEKPKKLKEITFNVMEKITQYYHGEFTITQMENVLNVSLKTQGKVILTNYRLLFVPYGKIESTENYFRSFTEAPIYSIDKIDIINLAKNKKRIVIFIKDYRKIILEFNCDNNHLEILRTELLKNCYQKNEKFTFAFVYNELYTRENEGWELYNPESEFKRQSLSIYWSCRMINTEYKLCPTYPRVLFFPTHMSNKDIISMSKKRSKSRIPTLSYFYKATESCIIRSSQPANGVLKQALNVDSDMLAKDYKIKYVLDARPKINAVANIASGGGYENINQEEFKVLFCGIQNIHVMRDSLAKIIDNFENETNSENKSNWLEIVNNSGWLNHLSLLLKTVNILVKIIVEKGENVLVHCSDGWDRTPQITSLAQILLDPFYRTIKGLMILITKEFLSFGHMFRDRNGNATKENRNSRSPIFTQFLDCIYQIMQQFPQNFEYSEILLEKILQESFACRYGTFLFNNDLERYENKVSKKTVSLWSNILNNIDLYKNNFFIEIKSPIRPRRGLRFLKVWPFYYRNCKKFINKPNPYPSAISNVIYRYKKEQFKRKILNLQQNCNKMNDKISNYTKIINNLQIKIESLEMKEKLLSEERINIRTNLVTAIEKCREPNSNFEEKIISLVEQFETMSNELDRNIHEILHENLKEKYKRKKLSFEDEKNIKNNGEHERFIPLSILEDIRNKSFNLRHISLVERNYLANIKLFIEIKNREKLINSNKNDEKEISNENPIQPPAMHPPNITQEKWDEIRSENNS